MGESPRVIEYTQFVVQKFVVQKLISDIFKCNFWVDLISNLDTDHID